MQIYCFDIDGTPEWPGGTAVTARDRRTSSAILLYRSFHSDAGAGLPKSPGGENIAAAAEQRDRARAVLDRFGERLPSAGSTGAQMPRPLVELFSCRDSLLLAAPDAATAAPVLSELRARGLFRDLRPALCSRCHKPGPVLQEGLCQACTRLKEQEEVLAGRKKQEELYRARLRVARSRRTLRMLSLAIGLISLIAVPLSIWWRSPTPEKTTVPVVVPAVKFTANHTSVQKGSRVLLCWTTSGLSAVSISPGVGRVQPSGKHWVVVNRDTTFSLIATGAGYTAPATVSVSVIDPLVDPAPTAAVDSSASAPVAAEPVATSAPVLPPTDQQSAAYEYEARNQIGAALNTWAAAYLANEPRRQGTLYAPQVERFFLHEHVDSAYVESYMTTFYNRGSRFTSFSFTAPEITLIDADAARATFVKNYTLQFPGGETRKVTSRSELHFIRIAGGIWKINFERDFKS